MALELLLIAILLLPCRIYCRDFDYGLILISWFIIGHSARSPALNCFDVIGMNKTLAKGAYWIGSTKEEAVIVTDWDLGSGVDLLQAIEQYHLAAVLRNIEFCKDFESEELCRIAQFHKWICLLQRKTDQLYVL